MLVCNAKLFLDISNVNINQQNELFEEALGQKFSEILHSECFKKLDFYFGTNLTESIKFTGFIFYCLIKIKESRDIGNEAFLASTDGQIMFRAYKYGIKYGIRPYIMQEFINNSNFVSKCLPNIELLYSSTMFYLQYLPLDVLFQEPDGKSLLLNVLYAVFSLKYRKKSLNQTDAPIMMKNYQYFISQFNQQIGKIDSKETFRIVMFLNTIQNLPNQMHAIISNFLSQLIVQPGGLVAFTELITNSAKNINSDLPIWKAGESVVKIVGLKGYTLSFYMKIFHQILEYISVLFMGQKKNFDFVPIYTQIINNYLNFNNEELRKEILKELFAVLDKLSSPPDLLTGLILLEHDEFCRGIFLLQMTFCSSSTLSLKSAMLIDYISLLFWIYTKIPEKMKEKLYVQSIIVQCLANRSDDELKFILKQLLFNIKNKKPLHHRVSLEFISSAMKYEIKIVPEEIESRYIFPVEEFVMLLKQSNHNILSYNIFLTILKFLDEFDKEHENKSIVPINSPELADSDQIKDLIFKNFNKQITLISTLSELINVKPLHSQFYENPNEILQFIQTIVRRYVNILASNNEPVLLVSLSIFEIFSKNLKNLQSVKNIETDLRKLLALDIGDELREKINSIVNNSDFNKFSTFHTNEFKAAVNLCKSKEPYIQVNGINNIIKLIVAKDQNTLANKHVILAIAIQSLKTDEDSYTYLHCIKLLTTLSSICESEVIETIIAEFLNDHNEIDFRLKLGETIVKITESIGDLAINYKNILINCFITGAQNKIDELRTSSLSNLGTICKILSFQIHNFFQELMVLIESIILKDQFLPARRAAVMILSQLLDGIDKLFDFQEYLLSIYRALKYILTVETDQTTILHAEMGLEILNRKTKEMIFPKEKLEKEIQILGVKDEKQEISLDGKNIKPKIIELN